MGKILERTAEQWLDTSRAQKPISIILIAMSSRIQKLFSDAKPPSLLLRLGGAIGGAISGAILSALLYVVLGLLLHLFAGSVPIQIGRAHV